MMLSFYRKSLLSDNFDHRFQENGCVYLSFHWLWPAFLSTAQYLSLSSGKSYQIFHFVSFWFYSITVITVIVKFLNFYIHSPPRFKNNSMRIFKRSTLITIIIIYSFSGSVDTIVFFKTGNHLPQCLWFSNSFFTVDGCIDCVRGILDS